MTDQRIAVLADIHGNADALQSALERLKILDCGKVVILGDLLTYGGQPGEVLDLLDELASRRACIFVRGNHDQFYFDLERGIAPFSDRTPEFIKESVIWSWKQSGQQSLSERYDWQDRATIGPVCLAHANPYAYGNWDYVANAAEWRKAADTLRAEGFLAGVFAHSHRSFLVRIGENGDVTQTRSGEWCEYDEDKVALFNPGSIGQPRGTGLSFMAITFGVSRIKAALLPIDIEFGPSERIIKESSLSAATQRKIVSYLRMSM